MGRDTYNFTARKSLRNWIGMSLLASLGLEDLVVENLHLHKNTWPLNFIKVKNIAFASSNDEVGFILKAHCLTLGPGLLHLSSISHAKKLLIFFLHRKITSKYIL